MLDWWPDDFVDFGLVSANNPIMKYLFKVAKNNYVKSDATVFSIKGCYKYFDDKKWDTSNGGPVDLSKVYYINNGVDLNDFNTWKKNNVIDDEDFKSDKKLVVYLGSVRLANNVGQLIRAAECLRERKDVLFLVYGDGDDREPLIQYCREHQLSNVKFKDKWIELKYVPYVLSQSYLNILNYTAHFGKYGVSSSKMFQYMAAGKPIVAVLNGEGAEVIKDADCGWTLPAGNAEGFAKLAIELSQKEAAELAVKGANAAKYYNEHFVKEKCLAKLDEMMNLT